MSTRRVETGSMVAGSSYLAHPTLERLALGVSVLRERLGPATLARALPRGAEDMITVPVMRVIDD